MLRKNLEKLKLGGAIVLFDRDFGISFFQDFRGYGSLLDDGEWLLERTPQRSWGFMIRPIAESEHLGLWIGEYGPGNNQIIREEFIFDRNASAISRLLFDYAAHKIGEGKVSGKLTFEACRRKLQGSKIIQDFKHYLCPTKRFYQNCLRAEKVYEIIREKYGVGAKIHYSLVMDVIRKVKPCEDVIICPLTSSSNTFETIINLNKALRNRKIGELKIINQNVVEII